jgi:hypothetical protein
MKRKRTEKLLLYIYRVKRCILVSVCLVARLYTFCQQQVPAGVTNTYILVDKDGYTGFNYATIYHAPSGKVYTKTYDGEVTIHGNNYTVPLPSISNEGVLSGFFYEVNENETWYYDSKKIAIIRHDTVHRIIRLPAECFLYTEFNKSLIYVYNINGYTESYTFSGNELVKKSSQSIIFPKVESSLFALGGTVFIYFVRGDSLLIYQLQPETFKFIKAAAYPTGKAIVLQIDDARNMIVQLADPEARILFIINGVIKNNLPLSKELLEKISITMGCYPYGLKKMYNKYNQIFNMRQSDAKYPIFISEDNTNLHYHEKLYGSFYATTGNKPLRIFTTIKKYPYLFNSSNANSIFAVRQDYAGDIWAGGYNGGISIIHEDAIHPLPGIKKRITNGGSSFRRNMYLIDEGIGGGLFRIDKTGNQIKLVQNVYGFYTYVSKDEKYFYYGTGGNNGLWQTTTTQLENRNPDWHKIDNSKGANLLNILTITEDTLGRIWCGHSKRGVIVYNPEKDTAKTWLTDKNETPFGAFSSLTDDKGTVWIGSGNNGLWYYGDYSKEPSPLNCKRINHPLLGNNKSITALTLYNNWLVISGYDKMMLLNLDSFYQKNKIIIRYLNPQEAAFTSFIEQNTLLTSKKDNTVWFSTSDMLYQWDVKQWLALPTYKVITDVFIKSNNSETSLLPGKTISFEAGFNSFDIIVHYLSPDNMPRYTSAALLREGDSILLPEPSLQHTYNIKNIGNGQYKFILEVFETDGTTSRFVYNIYIRKFLWQQWWFWAALSTLLIGAVAFFINQKRKRQLAEQKVKTKEAELLSFKSEQEKKLANLQLVTLSSQFRPHFILNALNTIGAQMDDKPEAESVLSRLGESVNLIFNHAQQQKILHPFENEWRLVTNVIHIHQLMYLKKLETNLPDIATIEHIKNLNVPLGILQIPVENALLHGLSNKESGPWNLSIAISEIESFLIITITDNGIGRKKSATLSNFTKHGTGTKNLNEIINIINAANADKISITYEDDIYTLNEETSGTSVIIKIPKQLTYVNG